MKGRERPVFLLLGGLLCIGVVAGLWQGLTREIAMTRNHFSTAALSHNRTHEPATQDIMKFLQPLLVSRNLGMIVEAVSQFSPYMVCSLASTIVCDSHSAMTSQDKLSFLFMLAHRNSVSKFVQFRLFGLMMKNQLFTTHSPALLGSAKKDYLAVFPSFLNWMHREKATFALPVEEKSLIDEAFYSAIEQEDMSLLEWLTACGMRIDAQKASELLVHVVYDRKKSVFIPFLIHRGADVNRIGPDRHTLLSKAIFYNDSITARTLLEAGADIDLRADDTIGSARQVAHASGNSEIEKLISMYSAKA